MSSSPVHKSFNRAFMTLKSVLQCLWSFLASPGQVFLQLDIKNNNLISLQPTVLLVIAYMKCKQASVINQNHASMSKIQSRRKLISKCCWKIKLTSFKTLIKIISLCKKHSGSDLAGETAAALAAASIVFHPTDSTYSQTLLTHSQQLYEFAKRYPGLYSRSIPMAEQAYG